MDSGRKKTDKRRETRTLPVGTTVGIRKESKIIKGSVYDVDPGGWIYVNWEHPVAGLPNYLRATQVFVLDQEVS